MSDNRGVETPVSEKRELRGDLMQRIADTSSSSHEPPMEPRAYVEPGSGKHSEFTHFPKDRNCAIRSKTKITRASCRRRANAVMPRAEKFCDLVTTDHKVLSEESGSRNNHRYAIVVQDAATMDPVVSVPNKNFPRDSKEPNEVPGASKKTKSHLQ